MEITNGRNNFCFEFNKEELAVLIECLTIGKKCYFNRIDKAILSIENNEDNEGQVKYSEAIRELRKNKEFIYEVEKEFSITNKTMS